jgi:hypothetical protein
MAASGADAELAVASLSARLLAWVSVLPALASVSPVSV